MLKQRVPFLLGCAAVLLGLQAQVVLAQATTAPSTQEVEQQAEVGNGGAANGGANNGRVITVELPEDLELKHLIEVVSKRLGINIIYNEQVLGRRVTLKSPRRIVESELLGVLETTLQMNGMALAPAEEPGWYKIVPVTNISGIAPTAFGERKEGDLKTSVVTRVYTLENADPMRIVEVIRPFLTQPGGNPQVVQGTRQLIISDYDSVIDRVTQIIEWLDAKNTRVEVRFIKLERAEAQTILPLIQSLLLSSDSAKYGGAVGQSVYVTADSRTNQLIILGMRDRVQEAVEMLEKLDAAVDVDIRVYRFQSVSAEQVDNLVKGLLEPGSLKSAYRSGVDRGSGALVVAAPKGVHEMIKDVIKDLDQPAQQSPIRFYKLKNAVAEEVLETIASLADDTGEISFSAGSVPEAAAADMLAVPGVAAVPGVPQAVSPPPEQIRPEGTVVPPANMGPAQGMDMRGRPPVEAQAEQTSQPQEGWRPGPPSGAVDYGGGGAVSRDYGSPIGGDRGPAEPARAVSSIRTRQASVTADKNTNTIIVIAPPSLQSMYEQLINQLDRRRPQVLIESTLVALDTTDDFNFGVDLGFRSDVSDDGRILSFGSFGVSEVDPVRGKLTPVDVTGGTFALLDPALADVVLRALKGNARSRLISMPQVLVNDNEEGMLSSELEVPFRELNTIDTGVTTTTVGGTVNAGTTITVEPHISEGDYLQLAYEIELSNFTSQPDANLPPPRQANTIKSKVTVPDGYTIVVGGLTTRNLRESRNRIPLLGDIPIFGEFFGNRSNSRQDTTLFIFLRPVILRDDQFEDLKYYSAGKLRSAELQDEYPDSKPILME